MTKITDADKLACAKRELAMRKKVYSRHVEAGWKTQEEADREIALMQAIVDDYLAHVRRMTELPL